MNGLPGPLHQRCLVGAHKTVLGGGGEGILQQAITETLRRLRQHNELPRNRGGDDRPVRGAIHLLDRVNGRQAHNRRAVLGHSIDGALNRRRIDERPHCVMHQHNIVLGGGQRSERIGHGLLPFFTALHHACPAGKTMLGNLRLHALHLGLAHGHVNRRHPPDRGKSAQRVNQDRSAVEGQELFWLGSSHPGAQPRGGKNNKHLHDFGEYSTASGALPGFRPAAQSVYHPHVSTTSHRRNSAIRLPLDLALFRPGTRLAVGLSGGADSVALLRALAGHASELGLVLHAAHLHHGLRGAEADADLEFCRALAGELSLPFHEARVDTSAEARSDPSTGKAAETLEEAARRLRYCWFRELLSKTPLDAIATAHTLDDQAETVLAKLLRGAWTEGLGGISPALEFSEGLILRPLLNTTRGEVEAYLKAIGQPWREDSTNRHLSFTRNRIRHELLPLLEGWNPNLRRHLSQVAALARDEDAWWQAEVARHARELILPGKPVRGGGRAAAGGLAIDAGRFAALAPALQRRLLRHAAARLGARPDFPSTEALRTMALTGRAGQKCEVEGLHAERTARELRIEPGPVVRRTQPPAIYEIPIPGEADAPAFGLRVRIETAGPAGGMARLRTWAPGDRVLLRHSSAPRKVKEILERLRITGSERALWPVLELAGRIVWMRGVELEPDPNMEPTITVRVRPLGE